MTIAKDQTDPESSRPRAEELVFALCHEAGNLLAAIRLRAHLLDPEGGPRALAAASVEIDRLCARTGSLLAQTRGLLSRSEPDPARRGASAQDLLRALEQELRDHGLQGVDLEVEVAPSLPRLSVEPSRLQPVLATLGFAALEAAEGRGSLRLEAGAEGEEIWITVVDDVAAEPLEGSWCEQAPRGRPLGWALAAALVEGCGGRLDVARGPAGTRVRLGLPARGA